MVQSGKEFVLVLQDFSEAKLIYFVEGYNESRDDRILRRVRMLRVAPVVVRHLGVYSGILGYMGFSSIKVKF